MNLRAALRVLAVLAGLGLLAFVVSRYPLAELTDALRRIGPWALATPFIALAWQAANTRGFQALVGDAVGFVELLRIKLAGSGAATLLPYGGVAGEALRMRMLNGHLPGGRAIAAVLTDRGVGEGLGMLYSSACVALLVARAPQPPATRAALLGYAGLALAGGIALTALVGARFPGRIGAFVARRLGGASAVGQPLPHPRLAALAAALAWQVVGRLLGACEFAVLLWRLGLPHDPLTCICLHGSIAAAGYVTFASPTGIGVMDAACVVAFGLLGFPGDEAVAFALARRARLILVGVLGVSWGALSRRRT